MKDEQRTLIPDWNNGHTNAALSPQNLPTHRQSEHDWGHIPIRGFQVNILSKTDAYKATEPILSARPIVSLILFSSLLIAWLNSNTDKVKSGNRQYNLGEFDQALQHYNDVLIDLPKSPYIHYNIGNAAYKKSDYVKALEAYTKSLFTDDKELEEKGNYNIGNCKYKQGKLKENSNLEETIQLFRESLDYYKRAIELNPKNMDTKFNHEFVERKLKELLDRQQKQESSENNNDSEQENTSGDKQKQSGKKRDDEREKQGESGSEQETSNGQKDRNGSVNRQQGEEKRAMTREEAMKLLDALKHEEQRQLPKTQERDRRLLEVFKDW